MTDPRLAEAQERAARLIELASEPGGSGKVFVDAQDRLAGWAEAVAALTHLHDTLTSLSCESCKLVTKFCDAMLGKRDG